MSPELETLDQLAGGDLSLAVIQELFPDLQAFEKGVLRMLQSGDVRMLQLDGKAVEEWRWKEYLGEHSSEYDPAQLKLSLTTIGAGKIT